MTQPLDVPVPDGHDLPRTPTVPATGRRRRRRNTTGESVAIFAIGLAGVAVAVAFTDAAPTGIDAVDAVYRAGLVVLLVLAGERARRWSLLIGSGMTAMFAVGAPRVGALAALAIILIMVLSDRRSRVMDALVGGLVGVAALVLQAGGPLGVETLLGIVATMPILYSAYTYTSKRVQRRWRKGAVLVLVAAVLSTALAGVVALFAVGDVEGAVAATRDGVAAAGDGDGPAAAREFALAEQGFAAADRRVGALWASPARLVPVVGPNVAVLQDSVSLGVELTGAAGAVAGQVDFDTVQQLDGGVDLATLADFKVPVSRAAEAADAAVSVLAGMDSPWIVGPLAERVAELSGEVAELDGQAELAELGVLRGPAMLGAEGPRRYLVLLGNPAELRDMGGHLGNWAELVATDGQLELVDVGGPLELATPLDQAPAWVREELPLSFSVLKPTEFPQNWGGNPDTEVVRRLTSDLYEQRTGRVVDGVIYADTAAFAGFLELSGPVPVNGLPEPFELTSQNAEQFLTRDQFVRFEREVDADAAVIDAIEEVFQRLTTTELPSPQALGAIFSPLVERGSLSMATDHRPDDALVDRLGLGGIVPTPSGSDVLGVFQRNAGPNKIDSFLSRSTDVQLQWSPVTGDVRSLVTVEVRNDAPSEGLNRLVLGNDAGAPYGSNVTDVSIITPFMLQSVRVDGAITGAQPLLEADTWRHTVRVAVPAGQSRVVTFEMFGQVTPGDSYELTWVGQPIMGDNTLEVTMAPSNGPAQIVQDGDPVPSSAKSGVDAGGDHVFLWRK